MEVSTPRVEPPSEEPQSTNLTPPSNVADTGGKFYKRLFTLIRLRAPKHDPEPECGVSTNPSVLNMPSISEPSNEFSQRSYCGAERAEDRNNEASGVEVYQEPSRQSATTYASTQSHSSPSNTFDGTNNSMNAPSDLSSAHSIVHDNDIRELEKGFLAAPKMKLSPTHKEDWEVIRARLDHTLQHLFQPTPGVEYRISREFLFAGESIPVLAPTVIIICCHESHKAQLSKILKTQPWLATSRYRWRVIVDKIEDLSNLLSAGQIAGIAVGSTVAFLSIMWVMWKCCCCRDDSYGVDGLMVVAPSATTARVSVVASRPAPRQNCMSFLPKPITRFQNADRQ